MYSQDIILYEDRVGALIGKNGKTKERLESALKVKISIDSESGRVEVKADDPEKLLRSLQVIRAINLGFSPERALRLLLDDQTLHVIDLSSYVGKDPKDLRRIKGRIIGERGRARRVIEETAKVYLSVYRHFVAIIGDFDGVLMAAEAVRRLIKGAPHKAVYNFLFTERRKEKFRRMHLWG